MNSHNLNLENLEKSLYASNKAKKQHCDCDLAHLERQDHMCDEMYIQVLEQHVLPSNAFFSRAMLIAKTTKLQQPPQKHECFSFLKLQL